MRETLTFRLMAKRIAGAGLMICSLAAFGDAKSDFELGAKRYNDGDVVEAMALLKRSADAGNADAQAFFAFVLSASQFEEESVAYYRKSAAQKNPEGLHGLAGKMANGEGVKQDLIGARKLFEEAAALGHKQSMNILAMSYMNGGLGFTDDERVSAKALETIRASAEGGFWQAATMMVRVYQEGLLGQQANPVEAKKWVELANKIGGVKLDEKKKRRR